MKKDRIQGKFLDELRRVPVVQVACNKCDLSRNSVYRWRNEDPYFASLMDDALTEGEEYINDLGESQLLTLIKNKSYPAIRFWLTHHHNKYKKQEKIIETTNNRLDEDTIIKELNITEEDFKEENRIATAMRIANYIDNQ